MLISRYVSLARKDNKGNNALSESGVLFPFLDDLKSVCSGYRTVALKLGPCG
jgi:hypothetical protein